MNYEDLSPELKERARACTTPEEILALASEQGVELNDEELQDIAGGMKWRCTDKTCSDFSPCPFD